MASVSYGMTIKNRHHIFDQTMQIYRDAVSYLIDIVLRHYDDLLSIEGSAHGTAQQLRQRHVEGLIHTTRDHTAAYSTFDRKFYKFPSYLRRDAINTAIGKVFSYKSMVQNWESSGRKGKRPFLNRTQDVMPCLYRGNTFWQNGTEVRIKMYDGHDWIWHAAQVRLTDYLYIQKHMANWKECAPILTKRNHKYELRFAFTRADSSFPKYVKDTEADTVIGIDLGINTDAVCSVVQEDGTVTGSEFINSPVEKDRLYGLLNTIRKSQQHGTRRNPVLWRYVNHYQDAIARHTVSAIVSYAVKSGAQIIVFEHLQISGKKRGSKKQRLALWRKREIQRRTEAMAARYGIRVSYICAVNTSRLAFDGSGAVVRGKDAGFKNQKLCRFRNGKVYNADLSASRNIAARYFLRMLIKSMPAKALLPVQAKVPELGRRTRCTLATLINCYAALHTNEAVA